MINYQQNKPERFRNHIQIPPGFVLEMPDSKAIKIGEQLLSDEYDLQENSQIAKRYHECKDHISPGPESLQAFTDIITFAKNHLLKEYFFITGGRLCILKKAPKVLLGIDLFSEAWPAWHLIFTHQYLTGIQGLIQNLNNPSQIRSTVFEIECMMAFERSGWYTAEYSPLFPNGGNRRSDLLITKNNGSIFVECKRSVPSSSKAHEQFARRCQKILASVDDELKQKLKSRKLRLEISFTQLPTDKNVSDVLISIQALASKGQLFSPGLSERVGNIRFTVCLGSEYPYFPQSDLRTSSVSSDTVSKPLIVPGGLSPEAEVVVSSHDLFKKKERIAADLLTDARHQLPSQQPSLILLDFVKPAAMDKPARSRMDSMEYANVLAIMANPFGDLYARYKTSEKKLLNDLFSGFGRGEIFK